METRKCPIYDREELKTFITAIEKRQQNRRINRSQKALLKDEYRMRLEMEIPSSGDVNFNSSGFDQYQPPQYTVIHQPPQETSVEIVQARENLMKSIQTFLKKFNRISFRETPKVLSLAWEKLFEIQHAFRGKQHQPEDIQELLHKLLKDLQIISEELAEYINSLSWNCRAFYDDDDEYTIQYREYLENSSKAVAPVLPTEEPDNSLSMGDEHLSTILETETDKLIKSSVENLVPIPNILTASYPKIDYLLEEFFGELTHINLIPPGINETDFDPEEEIRLIEELLYDNSSPRPPEESNSEISDATIKSSSPSLIPIEDSDSLIEEIDLFLDPDDSIPPELLSNDSLSLPETESFHFDHYDVLLSPRPPAKPPDDGIFFDFETDTGVFTAKVVEDISEHYVLMPKLLPTQPTLCPDIDTLLPFSSENEDKDCPDYEDSRARGFFHSSTRSSILSMLIWESDIRDLIDLTFIC
ncbi:hypothetical protein Tco_1067803 [Tanacetum coccineum]|uniref:Uncharacterized protein n=1 Tax=Tanacetum coccineum TaxID=301880 RepID=A0ABQ5HDZ6_9ASTR